jgi:DNA-binding response OmpR family regulator
MSTDKRGAAGRNGQPRVASEGACGRVADMVKKILVVDDDASMVDMLCVSLKAAGFATGAAADGIEALKKARSIEPDLILLDVVLPELDGYAVCEELRRDPATATVPIILLTGLPGEFPRLAGMESGATAYLRKPFEPRQLISRVRELLGREKAAVCGQA